MKNLVNDIDYILKIITKSKKVVDIVMMAKSNYIYRKERYYVDGTEQEVQSGDKSVIVTPKLQGDNIINFGDGAMVLFKLLILLIHLQMQMKLYSLLENQNKF